MPRRRRADWQAVVAVLAMVSVLAVATAAVIPGHWHSGLQGQSCNLCRNGHLPILTPLAPVQIHSAAPVEWSGRTSEAGAVCGPVAASHSPRAPPA